MTTYANVAVDFVSKRRPWLRRFLVQLDRRLDGGSAESHHETIFGDALQVAGVRPLVRQFPLDLPGYGPARFDLAVPTMRWAIEVDVFPTHQETEGRRRDRRRDEAAKSFGWDVTRIVESDLGPSIAATVDRVRRSFDRRRACKLTVILGWRDSDGDSPNWVWRWSGEVRVPWDRRKLTDGFGTTTSGTWTSCCRRGSCRRSGRTGSS